MAKLKKYNGSSWEDISIDADSATNDGNGNNIADTYAVNCRHYKTGDSLRNEGIYTYFKLASFPFDNAGNSCSLTIDGRIGGWSNGNKGYVSMIISNRDGVAATGTILGNAQLSLCDLVVYTSGTSSSNSTAIIYIKTYSWYAFDFTLGAVAGVTDIYDGIGTTTTPDGTLAWTLSDNLNKFVRVTDAGDILKQGTSVATVSQIPTKVSSLTNDAGYITSSNVGDTTMAVTRGTSRDTSGNGYWAAMCNSSLTGSPTLPASGWWHVISMDWIGSDINNWYSQLALPTQDGGVPHYRRNTASGTSIESSPWHAFITDENISDYANNTTYTLSSSGATVTLTPSSGTAQSITVDGVSNATNADKATHDSDGNIIASTYVKNTSRQLLSGSIQGYANSLRDSPFIGIPLLNTDLKGEVVDYNVKPLYISNTEQTQSANSVTAMASRTYAVQKDSDSNLVVNVPWTDTNTTQTTFTAAEYGLHFRGAGSNTYSYGIDLSGYSAGLHFATSNYRITDIETGTISLSSQAFTANTSVSKSVTFHNTGFYNAQGGTTTGAKQGSLRVFLQFVGYNGEQMTCGLISLTDTGFTAYCRCNATLSASSTRYIHWLKVREF